MTLTARPLPTPALTAALTALALASCAPLPLNPESAPAGAPEAPGPVSNGLPSNLPAPFTARVLRIVDGDGLYVEGEPLQIRLFGVDAPERGQDGFAEATDVLTSLVPPGVMIRVTPVDLDTRWNRIVARIHLAGEGVGHIEVNAAIIALGPAVEYCRYSKGAYGGCGDELDGGLAGAPQ